jgi:hypothetical protein
MEILQREEYIEQAYLFKALQGRLSANEPVQDMLAQIREEILSTTKLPMAIDFLLAEVRHVGTMSTAMKKLPHYFTQFQIFIIEQAEDEHGRFDMRVAFLILEAESKFRADNADPVAMFFFQVETLCRNCLDYDFGLQAMAMDPVYDGHWQRWILEVRHQLGLVELADLIYVNSDYYVIKNARNLQEEDANRVILFGEKEGRIALANRKKEPTYLFSSLQRQLGYPAVPRPSRQDPAIDLLPKLTKLVERMEVRIKLLEDEQRQSGIDLNQFMRDQKK